MSAVRKVRTVWKSRPTLEGAGVRLKRAFGFGQAQRLDPFLLLDDFHSDSPADYLKGFPWHPHRGIETITYIIHGEVKHGDSMGNQGVIGPGDVQWMTAGSGVIHEEMPRGDEQGRLWGFQLWANLPAAHKMMDPRYRGIAASTIPEAALEGGARARVICGTVGGVAGPVRDVVVDPELLDVTVPAGGTFRHPIRRGHTAFAYVAEGEGYFDDERDPYAHDVEGTSYFDFQRRACVCGAESVVHFGDGDEVAVTPEGGEARFLLVSGRPIGEPVAWSGPIVMNTQDELRTAFEEFADGTFVKAR